MVRRLVVASLTALVLSGCTGSDDPPTVTSSPGPIGSTAAATDPRIATFKTDNPTAQASYAFAARVALRYQFNSEYLRLGLDDMVGGDFEQFEGVLTKSALRTLRDSAGGRNADSVRALTFVDFTEELGGTDLTLRETPKLVISQRVTQPKYEFESGEPTIWLTSSGEVLVDSPEGPSTVPYAVRMKLQIHETKKGLRIHAWDSTWAFNGAAPAAVS